MASGFFSISCILTQTIFYKNPEKPPNLSIQLHALFVQNAVTTLKFQSVDTNSHSFSLSVCQSAPHLASETTEIHLELSIF